ncbi:MAG: VWA domain-containing protein [Akkermansiaceae bacterium]|nr:VWA domain-containing protein [Armatimonadota bacterium]
METTLTAITPNTLRAFILHLRSATAPFHLAAGATTAQFDDRGWHEEIFGADPLRYALLAVLPDIADHARARIVFVTLAHDAAVSGTGTEASAEIEGAIAAALCLLPADLALQVFLALRRERVNRKRVSRLVCRFLLNHPARASLWSCRRPAVVDVLEHALGRDVLRACVRIAGADDFDTSQWEYLRGKLLRYAHNPVAAKPLVAGLAAGSEGDATDYHAVSDTLRETFAARFERPATVTAADRGTVTGALTALYRQTPTPNLSQRFADGLSALAQASPRFAPGFKVALVFDTSTSMQGYGEREYCLAASAVTLWRLLCRVSAEPVAVFGTTDETEIIGSLPTLGGETDLSAALLDALETKPDLVIVLSDGYENRNAGDLARVAASLPGIGIDTPVLLCLPLFTGADDMAMRRPAPKLPELRFWHESGLPDLLRLAWLYTPQGAEGMTGWMQSTLLTRLKEMTPWMAR